MWNFGFIIICRIRSCGNHWLCFGSLASTTRELNLPTIGEQSSSSERRDIYIYIYMNKKNNEPIMVSLIIINVPLELLTSLCVFILTKLIKYQQIAISFHPFVLNYATQLLKRHLLLFTIFICLKAWLWHFRGNKQISMYTSNVVREEAGYSFDFSISCCFFSREFGLVSLSISLSVMWQQWDVKILERLLLN